MIHQLRIYEIFERNKAACHDRVRNHAARMMRSYGVDIIAMWESKTNDRTEFVYLLVWPDEQTMLRAWRQFSADEEWKKIKKLTNTQHGDLVGVIEERTLVPTNYSPSIRRLDPALCLRRNQSSDRTGLRRRGPRCRSRRVQSLS